VLNASKGTLKARQARSAKTPVNLRVACIDRYITICLCINIAFIKSPAKPMATYQFTPEN